TPSAGPHRSLSLVEFGQADARAYSPLVQREAREVRLILLGWARRAGPALKTGFAVARFGRIDRSARGRKGDSQHPTAPAVSACTLPQRSSPAGFCRSPPNP